MVMDLQSYGDELFTEHHGRGVTRSGSWSRVLGGVPSPPSGMTPGDSLQSRRPTLRRPGKSRLGPGRHLSPRVPEHYTSSWRDNCCHVRLQTWKAATLLE